MRLYLLPLIGRGSSLTNTKGVHRTPLCMDRINRLYCDKVKRRERTFIMVKPDGVHRGLIGEIIKRFEQKGYKLLAMKMIMADDVILKEHYKALAHKHFYGELLKYMSMGPLVPMIWEGDNVIATSRVMLGETDPSSSQPGTIRGDFGIFTGRNVCHGSDSEKAAEREIGIWFKPDDLCTWQSCHEHIIYED